MTDGIGPRPADIDKAAKHMLRVEHWTTEEAYFSKPTATKSLDSGTQTATRSVADRIGKVFKNAKVDVILIANTGVMDPNFLYLTDFKGGVFEDDVLIVTKTKETLITSELEAEIANSQRPKEMDASDISTDSGRAAALLRKRLKGKTVGVDLEFLPVNVFERIKKASGAKGFVDVSGSFSRAREIKGADEIANIEAANGIVKKAIDEAFRSLKVGMTEKELAAKIEYFIRKYGGDGASFPPIVAFGENSAFPHHMPDDTKLKQNSLVLLDCGAKYNNYCSDVTRTEIFDPQPNTAEYKRMVEMYNVVRDAQQIAMSKINAGAEGEEAYKAASNHINTAHNGRYKGTFIHGLGHAIGLEVHDAGMSLRGKRRLKEGMVVSNEPGVYIVGFGGVRLEDDVLVTSNGPKVL